jgi:hypothetical protein
LLAEAKLVDDVLTGRSLKSGPAAADNLGSKQAEPGARHEGAQAEYDAQQQAIGKELGDEVKFVHNLLLHVGGSPVTVAQALKSDDYLLRILKGQSRYKDGRWNFRWERPNPDGTPLPTPDELKALAKMFLAAAEKLNVMGGKIRSGQLDAAVRKRLEQYGLLTKGGLHGRWMCDGLAVEMAWIGRQIA